MPSEPLLDCRPLLRLALIGWSERAAAAFARAALIVGARFHLGVVAEAGYVAHLGLPAGLPCWLAVSRPKAANDGTLVFVSLCTLSFILAATPDAGPPVRYRLFAELLLLIALSGVVAPMVAPRRLPRAPASIPRTARCR